MKKQALTIIAIILACLSLVLLGVFRNQTFRLTSSTPKLGKTIPTSTGTIKLDFNREIDGTKSYTDNLEGDSGIINSISVEGKSVLIKLKPLTKDKKYGFAIHNIHSVDGSVIQRLPINFTARYVPYNKLSSEQKRLEVAETDKNNEEDAVLQIVPHQGDQFYLTSEYSATEDGEPILVLNAQLFLYRSDLGAGRDSAIEKYKNSVREFLSGNNLDPDKYLIRYEINEPPATAN